MMTQGVSQDLKADAMMIVHVRMAKLAILLM